MHSAREAAFFALYASLKEESFISDWLDLWQGRDQPEPKDFRLAREIAFGACRMALTLDAIAKGLTPQGRLDLKVKERALLRTALYQATMLDRIPLHAIVMETVAIAKKHGMKQKAAFFNALLRRLANETPPLPEGDSLAAISTRYSYPPALIKYLIATYGKETTLSILNQGNQPAPLMARVRETTDVKLDQVPVLFAPFVYIRDTKQLQAISTSPSFYIQNLTSALHVQTLAKRFLKPPEKILDLCASPGGKLLLAHDNFPNATLFANDITDAKVERLKQNLEKYSVRANTSVGPGETFRSEFRFDLIICDVPCSNTGVLNKRPEARWRFSEKSLIELEALQLQLIENASRLLTSQGRIWFMTCSIIPQENEELTKKACSCFNLQKTYEHLQLPSNLGFEGGYAVEMIRC